MGHYCSSKISATATKSEWKEISSALENRQIDWSCQERPYCKVLEKEFSFDNKGVPTPLYEGEMRTLSKSYPSVQFYYHVKYEDSGSESGWYCNGDETDKKGVKTGRSQAYKDEVQRFTSARPRSADGIAHRIEIMPDGRVAADGENRFGECNIFSWRKITQISCGNWHTVGLRKDGTVVACGSNANGQCDVSYLPGRAVAVSCGRYHTAILLDSGKVIVRGHLEQEATAPGVKEEIVLIPSDFPSIVNLRLDKDVNDLEKMNDRIELMSVGDELTLKKETQDGEIFFDVLNMHGEKIGYLLVEYAKSLAEILNSVKATVNTVTPLSSRRKGSKYAEMTIRLDYISSSEDGSVKKVSAGNETYTQTRISSWPAITRIKSIFDAVIGVTETGEVFVDGFCPCSENDIRKIADDESEYSNCSNFFVDEAEDEEDYYGDDDEDCEPDYDEDDLKWLEEEFGVSFDSEPVINFDGSIFVFTGLGGLSQERAKNIIQKTLEKGGQDRNSVSGKTNYLVVNPRYAGYRKLEDAVEQRKNGKNIQIVLLKDFEKALEGKTPAKKSSTQPAKTTTKTLSSKSTSTKSTTKSCSSSSSSAGESKASVQNTKTDNESKISEAKAKKNKKNIDDRETKIEAKTKETTTKPDSSKSKRDSSSSDKSSSETGKSNEKYIITKATGRLTKYNGKETDIVLPDGIKIIGEKAFNYKKITSVVIPEGVDTIEAYAFSNCKNLKSAVLSNTIKKIGTGAFESCEQLTDIVIPEGVETIDDKTFRSCENLESVTLPNTVKRIGDDAFGLCTQLTSIVIPEGCEELGKGAFEQCENLDSVTLPNTLKRIGMCAFESCEQLTDIVIPEGVELIVDRTFVSCKNLNSVTLPNTLEKIGTGAFESCELLTDIVIPEGVESIDDRTFWSCENLKSVTFPNTIKKIGKEAFYGCEQLISIVVPEGVETIDDKTFKGCKNLNSVTLPSTIKKIGKEAFYGCEQLASIVIPTSCEEIGKDAFLELNINTKVLIVEKGSVAEETVRNYTANKDYLMMKVVMPEAERKLQAFEQQIRSLIALSKESILPRVEKGDEKNAIVGQIISQAKAVIGTGITLSSGLAQYDDNAVLKTLRFTLGREFDSAEEIIDAIAEKKSAEYDSLFALLEKKNSDIRIARQEAAKLEEERSHLGFFQGKRKKEIAALLEQIQVRIKQIEDNYEFDKKRL